MIYGLSLGCMGAGAMMSEVLNSLIHHRFQAFYVNNASEFWFAIPINAVVIYLLIRRARQVARDCHDPAKPQAKAGVGSSLVGVKFHTNPFVRICVYAGFYILGTCLVFFL